MFRVQHLQQGRGFRRRSLRSRSPVGSSQTRTVGPDTSARAIAHAVPDHRKFPWLVLGTIGKPHDLQGNRNILLAAARGQLGQQQRQFDIAFRAQHRHQVVELEHEADVVCAPARELPLESWSMRCRPTMIKPSSGGIGRPAARIDSFSAANSRAGAHTTWLRVQFYNLMPVLSAEGNVELPLLPDQAVLCAAQENVAVALQGRGLRSCQHKPRELSRWSGTAVSRSRARWCPTPQLLGLRRAHRGIWIARPPTKSRPAAGVEREHGKTIVIVTHDPKAAGFARRTLHLEKGQLLEQAADRHLRNSP